MLLSRQDLGTEEKKGTNTSYCRHAAEELRVYLFFTHTNTKIPRYDCERLQCVHSLCRHLEEAAAVAPGVRLTDCLDAGPTKKSRQAQELSSSAFGSV